MHVDYKDTEKTDYDMYFMYDSYGYLSVIRKNDTSYYPATNKKGDVVAIYSGAGALLAEYEYDAWGNILSIKNGNTDLTHSDYSEHIANLNPIRYRGYYYDTDTKLYYLQSRYYNPELGRFLNADSQTDGGAEVLGFNVFAYAANNPVNHSDPTGHWIIKDAFERFADKVKTVVNKVVTSIKNKAIVRHNVPLYSQGDRPLCWAYSQVMVEDFQAGTNRGQEAADERAAELADSVVGEGNWEIGAWPTNAGEMRVPNNFYELYFDVKDGPLYGYYSNGESGHCVVITGADFFNKTVYTNNPWGVAGEQTYDDFLKTFEQGDGSLSFVSYSLIN